jgi:hypothetical protein
MRLRPVVNPSLRGRPLRPPRTLHRSLRVVGSRERLMSLVRVRFGVRVRARVRVRG